MTISIETYCARIDTFGMKCEEEYTKGIFEEVGMRFSFW
jgi:hypothetical protein